MPKCTKKEKVDLSEQNHGERCGEKKLKYPEGVLILFVDQQVSDLFFALVQEWRPFRSFMRNFFFLLVASTISPDMPYKAHLDGRG
jgi:hypothetical protein